MNVLFTVEGGEELVKRLKKVEAQFMAELAAAFPDSGEALRGQANSQAPRASGRLLSSSFVASEAKRHRVQTVVGYTDPKAPAVHEGIHWGHKISEKHRRKWLENALNAFAPSFAEHIAARLRRMLGGR